MKPGTWVGTVMLGQYNMSDMQDSIRARKALFGEYVLKDPEKYILGESWSVVILDFSRLAPIWLG